VNVLHSARCLALTAVALTATLWSSLAAAQQASYLLNPGDVLQISVWKEPELIREVLVRPDGKISFPLVGDVVAAGRTPEAVQQSIVEQMQKFIPDPAVTVSLLAGNGNKIYVLGKVARPGEYTMLRQLDVMQALAMAGGLNSFASENKVKILRRKPDGQQEAIEFPYAAVQSGDRLESNILLSSGDIVVVP
jgi:polysaccharide export outer membrane protein